MKNMISGEVKEIPLAELRELMDPSIHDGISRLAEMEGAEALVLYECLQMDSSCLGMRTVVVAGRAPISQTLRKAVDGRLGDVPSRFQYPVKFTRVGGA